MSEIERVIETVLSLSLLFLQNNIKKECLQIFFHFSASMQDEASEISFGGGHISVLH